MTEYYKTKLEAGLEYQDFISEQLRRSDPCIIVGAYSSRKYQHERGESMSGIEIKFDQRLKDTGRLYIEVAEKPKPDDALEYMPSGIMRDDNTWLYLIGDYEQAFLFSKIQLKMIYLAKDNWKKRGIVYRQTETSIGFTCEVKKSLEGLCLRHFRFEK